MYKDFGALPIHRDIGIASPDDPSYKIPVNVWLRLLQLIGVLAFIGGAIGLVNLWHGWTDQARGWWARIGAVILAFGSVGMAWMVVALRLVTLSLQF